MKLYYKHKCNAEIKCTNLINIQKKKCFSFKAHEKIFGVFVKEYTKFLNENLMDVRIELNSWV